MKHAIRTYSRDDELVASRREQIARRAMQLLVKKGYDRATMREIAEVCQMPTGTLYHYVGSKDDILYLVMERCFSDCARFFESVSTNLDTVSSTEALRRAIDAYYRQVDRAQDSMLFSYQEARNVRPEARQSILDQERSIVAAFEWLLANGCATGEFRIDHVKTVAHNIVIIGEMWAVRRWFLRETCTLEEYIKEEVEFILRAIRCDEAIASEA